MTTGRRLAACLFVVALVGLGAANAALAAQQPSPNELWELYPLDPAGRDQRPATTPAAAPPSPPPQAGGAGAVTVSPDPAVATADRSADDSSLSLALLLGGLAAAIVLLATAALPAAAAPRVGGLLAQHRLELALAGAVTLLAVAVAYLATAG